MKRSMQEVVELVVFALIALLVGTGVVWLVGWILGLAGVALTWLAGLVWSLLRFLVPIALVAGAVYLLVRLMNRSASKVAGEPQKQPATPPSPQTAAREAAAREAAAGDAAAGDAAARDEGAAGTAVPGASADAPTTSGVHETDAAEPKRQASEEWLDDGGSTKPTPSPAGDPGADVETDRGTDGGTHGNVASGSDGASETSAEDADDEDDRRTT